ncbi:MAG: hypothetical protein HZC15_01000 [Candidatus Omnitrophica bacterium]|nr:hypothetical protein [Candidatus Omnitrophota bacterium]
MNNMSEISRDFVASHLRLQLNRLRNILNDMETEKFECSYTQGSLKELENNLRQIRKYCGVN